MMPSSDNTPSVMTVILTWNKKNHVLNLLDQLQHIDYPADQLEILVVDNASADGTAQAVNQAHPQIRLIQNPANLGGAGGFNTGMRWALENRPNADYLWLLDDDVQIEPNTLSELVKVLQTHPRAGLCGSKLMNSLDKTELVEIGAYIDYHNGDLIRNAPPEDSPERWKPIHEVDYVAACSLLARMNCVRELGIWNDELFIYWDDIEWGARFKAAGYQVLATTTSVVYHPSWAGRTADNSAIWRCYYRARNSLWFFSNYTRGLKKRLLMLKMVLRYGLIAINTCTRCHIGISKAFIQGMEDFFQDVYGKIATLPTPDTDLKRFLQEDRIHVCFFLPEAQTADLMKTWMPELKKKFAGAKLLIICPEAEKRDWVALERKNILFFRSSANKALPFAEKIRIYRFLRHNRWDIIVTTTVIPRMLTVFGKPVARVDFETRKTIAIEALDIKHMLRLPFKLVSFCYRLVFTATTPKSSQSGKLLTSK